MVANKMRLPRRSYISWLIVASMLVSTPKIIFGTPPQDIGFRHRQAEPVVQVISFTHDSKGIAAGVFRPADSLRLWDATTGQPMDRLNWIKPKEVSGLVFSTDGKYLAINGADVWNLLSNEHFSTPIARGYEFIKLAQCFSQDCSSLYYMQEGVHEFNLARKKLTGFFSPERKPAEQPYHVEDSLTLSTDGTKLGGTVKGFRIWDVASRKEIAHLELVFPCLSAEMSPDGKLVAILYRNILRFWDVGKSRYVSSLDGTRTPRYFFERDLAWDPDSTRVLVSEHSRGLVLVSARDAKFQLAPFPDKFDAPCLCFSPDGKKIAAANDEEIRVLHLDTKKTVTITHGMLPKE